MKGFLEEKLHIVHDGVLHVNEIIAIAIVAVLLIIIVLIISDAVKRRRQRGNTIFSHRKNRYKSRLGRRRNKY